MTDPSSARRHHGARLVIDAAGFGLNESLDASAAVVHLWVGGVSSRSVPGWVREGALLDSNERGRARRLERIEDRAMFAASHTALRLVLSLYTGEAAHRLAFDTADARRPELAWSAGPPPVRFSLTHPSGLYAISVTRRAPCGVDAERLSPRLLDEATLRAALSQRELAHLSTLAPREATRAFYRLWTRKE